MHLSSGALDLDKLEASLKRKTAGAGAGGGGAKTLKWLKDTSAAPKSTLGRADEQRAQIAAAASGGSVGADSAGSVRSGGGGASSDAPALLYSHMIGGPGISPSVHVKQPVLKSLRNATGGVDKSSMALNPSRAVMIEVLLNDRLGKKVRVKVNSDDTILTLKKLAAAQLGTKADKIRIQKCQSHTNTAATRCKQCLTMTVLTLFSRVSLRCVCFRVHRVQRSRASGRLRDSRRNELGAILHVSSDRHSTV